MRIAYVVNQIPKVSHAFIRREIAGLLEHGVDVERYSIPPPPEGLVDAGDLAEQKQTRVILGVGWHGLLWAMLCRSLGGPPYSFRVHGPEEIDKPKLISLTEKIQN